MVFVFASASKGTSVSRTRGPCMDEEVVTLMLAEGPVQSYPSGAQTHHGEERDHDVCAIAARCRHGGSTAYALPGQHVTGLRDFTVQLGERE